MRRKDREVTDYEKMLEIVKSCDCCRIGLTDGDEAYIVPLNFGYEYTDGKLVLYFHSAKEGRKIELINKTGKAAFEMDGKHELVGGEAACSYTYMYECVMGNGKISVVQDEDEKIYGIQKIMEHYTGKNDWEFKTEALNMMSVIKLEVVQWSCKVH